MDQHRMHMCPHPEQGMLPSKIIDDASSGKTEEVMKWIDQGGDVNAGNEVKKTLLHLACEDEQTELVKKLLEHPDIHLNTRSSSQNGMTPLGTAATFGHVDIVELLLEAKHAKCAVDPGILLGGGPISNRPSAVIFAVQGKHWSTVRVILKHYRPAREAEAFYIFCRAVEDYEFDIAQSVIQLNHPFKSLDFSTWLQELYLREQWEIVETTFQKNVAHGNDFSKRLLYMLVIRKDWKNLEILFRLMNGDQDGIHVNFVESVLEKKKEEVAVMLNECKEDERVMASTLLVATIGGTSQEVADLLVNDMSVEYSDKTLDNALILSSVNNRLEFLPLLLQKKKFTYEILSRARSVVPLSPPQNAAITLLQKVLEEKAKEYGEEQKT